MLKKLTIYGERCSGTNYLENLINLNFDVNIGGNTSLDFKMNC